MTRSSSNASTAVGAVGDLCRFTLSGQLSLATAIAWKSLLSVQSAVARVRFPLSSMRY